MHKLFAALSVVLLVATLAWAKPAIVVIEYSFDPDFEENVTAFKLYMADNDTDPKTYLATQELVSARTWTTPIMELPPGRTMNYYLSAVYDDGSEEFSPAYQFKLTGKPTIIKVSKGDNP